MDAVASASLDALLEDFAGSDQGLVAIVERFKVSSIVHRPAAHAVAGVYISDNACTGRVLLQGSEVAADARAFDVQATKPAKASNTLGALLQRLLYLLSHPEKAVSILESHGLPQPPMPGAGTSQGGLAGASNECLHVLTLLAEGICL